jgi:hypothetical protein
MADYQRRIPLGIVSHDAFLRKSGSADLSHYRDDPSVKVAGRAAFREMQDHIDKLYDGVTVVQSYEDIGGQVIDCIPIEQQPGLRNARSPMPTPPDLSGKRTSQHDPISRAVPAPTLDRHGNVRSCPQGTIPMRRITLDELVRFENLDSFFRKYPPATSTMVASIDATVPVAGGNNHRYSAARQGIANIGGMSYLSVNQPSVNNNEIFSLSQQWFTAGSGLTEQTVEVGWQVFPTKYGNALPNLFIFYTNAGYQNGSGSYNLDDANTFVQLSNNYTIGGAVPQMSMADGTQQNLLIATYLSNGAWWIYVNGLTSSDILGYYPTTLFGAGPMTTAADAITFGGETVSGDPPNGNWGQMGTGVPGTAGWPDAAYQCCIAYWGTDGTDNWANLSQVASSACYPWLGGFDSTSWGTYFFFGGAGGGDC